MREKDLRDMIAKLTQLKLTAQTPQEILNTLEDVQHSLQNLQSEVKINSTNY
jgi:hypothetical protein